ncbi:MAG TPA: GTP cyclohydrolase II [Thermomicrobiaceae bacterium]|nr:GTP cyclohydrolase II [Thermomicrobiaceae bacterium]
MTLRSFPLDDPETRALRRLVSTRLPTAQGSFRLCLYDSADGKEHLALVLGEVAGRAGVLVRVHSECFTGDVLGSLRCDCGEQLRRSLELIAAEGCGVLVYLRQEGRGIGLLDKLRAYNLQDQGYDTVDANLLLGHEPDERDYRVAAEMLDELDVRSIRLLTNNPAKLTALRALGVRVAGRVPLHTAAGPENLAYLTTKARRMAHQLEPGPAMALDGPAAPPRNGHRDRPAVTLAYAQSLDGSLAARAGEPLALSGPESLVMTHRLRAAHDAILVGIGTVLADDPRLSLRLAPGCHPRPVILDGHLRFPLEARLLAGPRRPWIATGEEASRERQQALEAAGARVLRLPLDDAGLVALPALLRLLAEEGIERLMVEGGPRVIASFLRQRLADQLVITLAPRLVGGLRLLDEPGDYPSLRAARQARVGQDLVLWGEPEWT